MLLSEVRDRFVVEYKLNCQTHEVKEIGFDSQDKIIAAWIASGQQDILGRLKILKNYVDIDYDAETEFTSYDLPDDWGSIDRTEPELKIRDISELQTYVEEGDSLTTGEPHSIAVYNDGNGFKCAFLDVPLTAGTVRIWYHINTSMYSPGSTNNFGSFNGTTFSGKLKIPDTHIDLLILYMLGKCFNDKKLEYEETLLRMRGDSGSTQKQEIEWTPLGGY